MTGMISYDHALDCVIEAAAEAYEVDAATLDEDTCLDSLVGCLDYDEAWEAYYSLLLARSGLDEAYLAAISEDAVKTHAPTIQGIVLSSLRVIAPFSEAARAAFVAHAPHVDAPTIGSEAASLAAGRYVRSGVLAVPQEAPMRLGGFAAASLGWVIGLCWAFPMLLAWDCNPVCRACAPYWDRVVDGQGFALGLLALVAAWFVLPGAYWLGDQKDQTAPAAPT